MHIKPLFKREAKTTLIELLPLKVSAFHLTPFWKIHFRIQDLSDNRKTGWLNKEKNSFYPKLD